MPTTSGTEPPAATAALAESDTWAGLADSWQPERHREIWRDLPPIEERVIPGVDAISDLSRRAKRWNYSLDRGDFGDIALFAAALARTEGEAWSSGDPSVATLAYEDRRFLAADRLVPWAVPWLLAAARSYPSEADQADETAQTLLELGQRHRLAPRLVGSEGLVVPGHDGYGPLNESHSIEQRTESLCGGLVAFGRGPRLSAAPESAAQIVDRYEAAAAYWKALAASFAGTARFWLDLAERALVTARIAG